MDKTSLGDRMKRYEEVSQHHLIRRTPVIIRVDGKAFHNFTHNMRKPFDERLMICMQETTKYLVKEVDGCSFGYTQSDEISLLLTDYKTIDTQPFFEYKLQKLTSVIASMATAYFNYKFDDLVNLYRHRGYDDLKFSLALFDTRSFNMPKDEVVNYFIWRQQDATRNSIQMVAQTFYSHNQLHEKNCKELQEMIFKKGINWNDLEPSEKRGTGIYKQKVITEYKLNSIDLLRNGNMATAGTGTIRTEIVIDNNTPIFTLDRNYIQQWVDVDKEITNG